ncbi:hypothetical protein LLE49_19890 [Alicyclobacillus tolerans]|uniref:hypothetical protein n=1 Tax=Alicyclobacillus tolerans TaxID=90970 RepID=UPI001F15833C|nr:hypothetical protein [Alicyclobacillus tolerans]MCF8566986.1 hypothetical protein [Alicyclobacillus tolerans]
MERITAYQLKRTRLDDANGNIDVYLYTRLELQRDLGMVIPRGIEPVNLGTNREPKYDRRECVSREGIYDTLLNLPGGLVSEREIRRFGSLVLPGSEPVAKLLGGYNKGGYEIFDLYPRRETVPYCKLYYKYYDWDQIPEFYKTRHALKLIGLKPPRGLAHVAKIYSGRRENEYYLYDIKDCVNIHSKKRCRYSDEELKRARNYKTLRYY